MENTDNKYIKVAYKLYTIEDGEREFMEEATAEEPFEFISGLGLSIEAFEKKVEALAAGETFDFVIPAKQAYGEYDDNQVVELPKNVFCIDGKFDDEHVKEGAVIPLITATGERFSAVVNEVKGEAVVVDLNHPLAGCDLNFVGSVVENRTATPEEIEAATKPAGGCGCHCQNGKEGCCEGGACGGNGDCDCGPDCECHKK